MMLDGVVSIGDGKAGNEPSPNSKRRGTNLGTTNATAAPVPINRTKRSPQGSVAGESSTKGSERDDMEEVSNEEGRCDGGIRLILGCCLALDTVSPRVVVSSSLQDLFTTVVQCTSRRM